MPPRKSNRAVTSDGAAYNKLARPHDYLDSLTSASTPPPRNSAPPPLLHDSTQPPNDAIPPNEVREMPKRKLDEEDGRTVDGQSDSEPVYKRPRHNQEPTLGRPDRSVVRRPYDVHVGMSRSLPDMDESYGSDGSTNEALAYLASVKREANEYPHVVFAQSHEATDNDDQFVYGNNAADYQGYYEDGAYISRDIGPVPPPGRARKISNLYPQDVYNRALMKRYRVMRRSFASVPPAETAERSKLARFHNLVGEIPVGKKDWVRALHHKFPTPAIVSQLSNENLLRGIDHCTSTLSEQNSISKELSCWIWALLARAPEVEVLGNSEVSSIRELAKAAIELATASAGTHGPASFEDEGSITGWDIEDGGDAEGNEGFDERENPRSSSPGKKEDDVQEATADPKAEVLKQFGDRLVGESRFYDKNEHVPETVESDDGAANSDAEGSHAIPSASHVRAANVDLDAELKALDEELAAEQLKSEAGRVFNSRAEAEAHRQAMLLHDHEPDIDRPVSQERYTFVQPTKLSGQIAEVKVGTGVLDLNTKVTTDMIIAIAAECYGQKDLLDNRDIW